MTSNLIPPDKQPTRVKPRRSRKALVKEGKSNTHERFMKQNIKMIALSGAISLCFACSLTFLFVYMAPVILNYVQDGILELLTYLRGSGDTSMITAMEAAKGIPVNWLPVTMNLTKEHFYSTYYQKEVVVFPGRVLAEERAQKEAFKLAHRGSSKKVMVHEFTEGTERTPCRKSMNEFRRMKVTRERVVSKWGRRKPDNIFMEESSQLLAKSVSKEKSSNIDVAKRGLTLDLGGAYKFTTVHNGSGPPFRQSRHRIFEVIEGSTKWVFFHPNALPTIGYSHVDHYTIWMQEVYPLVSPLFSPLQLILRPGDVLYIPEGYYYTYTAESASASMVLQEALFEDAGAELYCLHEGDKRLAASDFTGAAKLFSMGLELKDKTGRGQGRYSHRLLMSLGNVHEMLGSFESAETAYRDAISQNARHISAYESYMAVVMRIYADKKQLLGAPIASDSASNRVSGASTECTASVFVEARNEARYKIRNSAALARTSGVLTDALAEMNATFLARVSGDKDLACGISE